MDGERLCERFAGPVAGSFAVDADTRGSAPCVVCGRTLSPDDRITATWRNYDGHTWGLLGRYYSADRVERVGTVMDIKADEQAVVETTLEPTGYRDPLGDFHPRGAHTRCGLTPRFQSVDRWLRLTTETNSSPARTSIPTDGMYL